ncbi:hypothetical protein FB45DRAFT_922827 [Roridomyces roridus]|uniref:Uncharacterized protein n=1 Tax=Roridomyces roridus TaxID=1738132 RepID=A0AAD7FL58_9AGAR|nr:hypothetical protein FB45DRAFT_922827 [Roridomyces roridus]
MYSSQTPLYTAPRPITPNPRPIVTDGSRSPNLSFQVEHVSRPPSAMGNLPQPPEPSYDPEFLYRENVSKLIAAKTRPFSVSGRIPFDPSHLILFFRSKTGITHSLDFPVDIDYNSPPALDVLIATCKRHSTPGLDSHLYESFYYPSNLPLTPSLEIAYHPILAAIRNTLFPTLPTGHHLTVRRDTLDIIIKGGSMAPQPRSLRADGRIATLSIGLPVRFRGGALVIRDTAGNIERLETAAPTNDLEWTAFLGECEYEVEPVTQGARVALSYAVFARSFAAAPELVMPSEGVLAPLVSPSQPFLDLLPPVLQMSRGRKLGFLLSHDYDADPSALVAESLVPLLKGGDSLLYHALKVYKLKPVLHWTAGGYVWPLDRTVELFDPEPLNVRGSPQVSAMRGAFGGPHSPHSPHPSYANPAMGMGMGMPMPITSPGDALRARVEASGAIPLADADVSLLSDWRAPEGAPVGKARVYFVENGGLERLVVNVLLVVFVV